MRFALLREVDMGANTYLTERERHIMENAKVGISLQRV